MVGFSPSFPTDSKFTFATAIMKFQTQNQEYERRCGFLLSICSVLRQVAGRCFHLVQTPLCSLQQIFQVIPGSWHCTAAYHSCKQEFNASPSSHNQHVERHHMSLHGITIYYYHQRARVLMGCACIFARCILTLKQDQCGENPAKIRIKRKSPEKKTKDQERMQMECKTRQIQGQQIELRW